MYAFAFYSFHDLHINNNNLLNESAFISRILYIPQNSDAFYCSVLICKLTSTMQLLLKITDNHYHHSNSELIQLVSMVSSTDDHCVGLTAILHPQPGLKMHNGASSASRTPL